MEKSSYGRLASVVDQYTRHKYDDDVSVPIAFGDLRRVFAVLQTVRFIRPLLPIIYASNLVPEDYRMLAKAIDYVMRDN